MIIDFFFSDWLGHVLIVTNYLEFFSSYYYLTIKKDAREYTCVYVLEFNAKPICNLIGFEGAIIE